MLEAKKTPFIIPQTVKHKNVPYHEIYPPHFNDVRFNFKPERLDRRMFIHTNMVNKSFEQLAN